jgi:hypothetical protein
MLVAPSTIPRDISARRRTFAELAGGESRGDWAELAGDEIQWH